MIEPPPHIDKSQNVTCLKCGWVHFQVPRAWAEHEVQHTNEWLGSMDPESRSFYGPDPATILTYERCGLCGGSYKNFRDSKDGDCPDGCTIGSIIDRND